MNAGPWLGLLVFLACAGLAAGGDETEAPGAAHGDETTARRGWGAYFFPLFYYDKPATTGRMEVNAAWPLGLWRRPSDGWSDLWAVHPLYSRARDETGRRRLWDILFPLIGMREIQSAPDDGEYQKRVWALPIYFYRRARDKDRRSERLILFPFLFSGRSTPPAARHVVLFPFFWDIEKDASSTFPLLYREADRSLAFFPFWGIFRGVFKSDTVRFILWPLWVHSNEGPDHKYSVIWPFFGRTVGPERTGWRAWPLFSTVRREGVGRQTTYLWPLGHSIERQAGEGKPSFKFDGFLPFFFRMTRGRNKVQYYFPFYGSSERPNQRTDAWLWPLYMRTVNKDPDWTQHRILFFFAIFNSDPEDRRRWVFPFFGKRERPKRESQFMLFPFYFRRGDESETGRRFKRQYFFPFFINERWTDREGDLIKHRRAILPFYRKIERGDGSREMSWPHLWWYVEQPGILRNWAPLWTFYESRDDGRGRRERRVFWRLWRKVDVEGVGSEVEFNFLLGRYHRSLEGERRFSLLGINF